MQKAEALAQIEVIIDDLSNGELFDAIGEALEVVRLCLRGRILPSEAHRHVLLDIINQQLATPPDEHRN